MNTISRYLWTFIAGLFIGAATLFMWQKPVQKAETSAAEQRQSDGSLILARDASAKPATLPKAPKGGKAVRSDTVTVQPSQAGCPICTVNLTMFDMKDGSHRVVANSPTGTVVSGLDIPLVPLELEKSHPWAAGVSRGTGSQAAGFWIDRDFGPLRVGGEVNQSSGKTEARIRAGLRW